MCENVVGVVSWSSSTKLRFIEWDLPDTKLENIQDMRSPPDFIDKNQSLYLMLHSTVHSRILCETCLLTLDVFKGSKKIPYTKLRANIMLHEDTFNFYLSTYGSFQICLQLEDNCMLASALILVYFDVDPKAPSPEPYSKKNRRLRLGLSQNLKVSYLKKLHSDFQINIGERVFDVHKMVLAARSSVFAAMLGSDMSEKYTNSANISDCDADAFHVFLLFLYSGEIEDLSRENVINVYVIADKYEVDALKIECVTFMMDNISAEEFFDIAVLASKYSELELLKECHTYFKQNAKTIFKCKHWDLFLKEYSSLATEFLMLLVS